MSPIPAVQISGANSRLRFTREPATFRRGRFFPQPLQRCGEPLRNWSRCSHAWVSQFAHEGKVSADGLPFAGNIARTLEVVSTDR
jgi:hypothetical protein